MSILEVVLSSLEAYVKADGSVDVPAPQECTACGRSLCFWKHTPYSRTAIEDGASVPVKIPRFMCRYSDCRATVSRPFSFLVPYGRYTVRAIASAVELYATTPTSYRKVADGIGVGKTDRSAGRSSVHRWVTELASKAKELVLQVQKECMLVGRRWQDLARLPEDGACPNASRAQTENKAEQLNVLMLLVLMARFLLGSDVFALEQLHAHFLRHVESPQLIFTGGGIDTGPQQTLGHLIV
jgi:hypothetical protein